MLDSRKREIRIKADYFRTNCKIGRYGIINLFKECERMGYKLVRYGKYIIKSYTEQVFE